MYFQIAFSWKKWRLLPTFLRSRPELHIRPDTEFQPIKSTKKRSGFVLKKRFLKSTERRFGFVLKKTFIISVHFSESSGTQKFFCKSWFVGHKCPNSSSPSRDISQSSAEGHFTSGQLVSLFLFETFSFVDERQLTRDRSFSRFFVKWTVRKKRFTFERLF